VQRCHTPDTYEILGAHRAWSVVVALTFELPRAGQIKPSLVVLGYGLVQQHPASTFTKYKEPVAIQSDKLHCKWYYLALQNICPKCDMLIRDWKLALNWFSIEFEDCISQRRTFNPFIQ
jgi:hypothetical protein